MSDLIKREDAIETIHNYWKKRLDTLPTTDIQQMDKILEHNKTLCNFIDAIPSADRPQGEWIFRREFVEDTPFTGYRCSNCNYWQGMGAWNYCPNCGSRMKGADDE